MDDEKVYVEIKECEILVNIDGLKNTLSQYLSADLIQRIMVDLVMDGHVTTKGAKQREERGKKWQINRE